VGALFFKPIFSMEIERYFIKVNPKRCCQRF
jgi:hypothetical protein